MLAPKPVLTVDVNAAQQKISRTARNNPAAALYAGSSALSAEGRANGEQQQQQQQPQRGKDIRTGDIVTEEDLAAQNGFGSDDDTQDAYERGSGRGARRQNEGLGIDSQDFVDSESSEEDEYGHGQDDEMGSEEDEELYDEDEELSSSPSIPDENIDFDLVYALHNFIATVEGQATVSKGNSLTLLDDSNSYWWLVRVLRTQEVGYIPAENIETPYERLARLNKHRNVDLTSATNDDHNQIPDNVVTSHLVKSRAEGVPTLSTYSGKPSALSRRSYGPKPSKAGQYSQRGVAFGEPTYLEHSDYEYSDDEDEDEEGEEEGEDGGEAEDDMIDIEDEQGEDEDGDDEDDEEYEDEDENDRDTPGQQQDGTAGSERSAVAAASAASAAVGAASGVAAANMARTQGDARQAAGPTEGEPRSTENMTSQNEIVSNGHETKSTQSPKDAATPMSREQVQTAVPPADDYAQWSAPAQQLQGTQALQNGQMPPQRAIEPAQDSAHQQTSLTGRSLAQNGTRIMGQVQPSNLSVAQTQPQQMHEAPGQPTSQSQQAFSSANTGPSAQSVQQASQIAANRERAASDAALSPRQSLVEASPTASSKKDKRSSHRKSRSEDEIISPGDEKQTKKRSGVFSGLFSRSKDKKERKLGHSSSNSADASDTTRTSEDSTSRNSLSATSNGAKTLQDRERAQPQAFSRQFLSAEGVKNPRQRPGSLVGPSGTAPMLNVLRIFAGNDIPSGATFKTVLLNETTTSSDLVRQAVQRFRLGPATDMDNYILTVKSVEGDERSLRPEEMPLQVFDKLTEALTSTNRETPTSIPSVKRSSVGSISSVSSNLSLNPAIARLESDFSDDHNVKFYLHRRATADSSYLTQTSSGRTDESYTSRSAGPDDTDLEKAEGELGNGLISDAGDRSADANQSLRFALRLLIFPSDLPDGTVFDPQSNALIPRRLLSERGPGGAVPADGISHDYREKHLALPRNTTVADVIELGLDRFGIVEGVVEGGDNVEDRDSRRRSKNRVRYGLCVKVGSGERSLAPNSKVLDAYPFAPTFKAAPNSRRSKRLSTDSAMVLSYFGDSKDEDPVFILRQVQRHRHSLRPLSPTENMLATKQDQRRQAELNSVASTSNPRQTADPSALEQQGLSRQEIIAAQREAARERRAAILGTQLNSSHGVDVVLDDRSRLRSSRVLETGQVRYSFIPQTGEEYDISAIVEDVLGDESQTGIESGALRPTQPAGPARSLSAISGGDYVSAPNTPVAASPIPLEEVNMTNKPSSQSVTPRQPQNSAVQGLQGDALHSLIQSESSSGSVADRIERVLARIDAKTPGNSGVAQTAAARSKQTIPVSDSMASSRGTTSPTSAYTEPSGANTPTQQTLLASATAGGAALAAGIAAAAAINSGGLNSGLGATPEPTLRQAPVSVSMDKGVSTSRDPASRHLPAPSPATTDFGVSHLFALTEAAARKRPVARGSSRTHSRMTSSFGTYPSYSPFYDPDNAFKPTVAGLFPPQAPYIEDRRVKEAYAPIGRNLNGLEESLDKLLSDVLRTL